MKKNVLISYVVNADTDLEALLSLRGAMTGVPNGILERFQAFDVLDVEEK